MLSQSPATRSKNSLTSLVLRLTISPFSRGLDALLFHGDGHDSPGEERQCSDGAYGPRQSERVGDDTGREGADRVAEIPPEAVDAQGSRPPGGVRVVRDGRYEGRVDHRRTQPQEHAPEPPPTEVPPCHSEKDARRLGPHPHDDRAFPAPPVAQRAGRDRQPTPSRRTDSFEDPNLADAESEGLE